MIIILSRTHVSFGKEAASLLNGEPDTNPSVPAGPFRRWPRSPAHGEPLKPGEEPSEPPLRPDLPPNPAR